MSLFQILYVGRVSPYILPIDNIFEIFNEFTILLVLTTSTRFADSPFTPEFSSNMGFTLIGVIVFNISINMLYFLVEQLRFLWSKIRQIKCIRERLTRKTTVEISEMPNEKDMYEDEVPYFEE
jgi:hypothetical protein